MYKKLIHGIQALRRQTELSCCPVLGGAGVKAFCYPHQLYVVNRILTDTRIRHLLADEVGLGKTLEALMIMNALWLRNQKKLRVGIVVGSKERAEQWRGEIYSRFPFPFWKNDIHETCPDFLVNGNVFFKDFVAEWDEDAFEKDNDFKIIYPQNFDENRYSLEPESLDLLILDEIHSFSNTLLAFLASRTERYSNLLVLSATPLLGEENNRKQLLSFLSPEHAELYELKGESSGTEPLQSQILRSRRLDFPRALSQREPKIIRIEPLENEERRFKKARRLMQSMVHESLVTEENAALFIRRATVGGQTLIDRIDEYRSRHEKYAPELTELREFCSTEQGDTRFDALMEYLVKFFSEDARRKLIIAAQDNPTIRYLSRQIKRCLPEAGPIGQQKEICILEFFQEGTRSEDTETDEDNENGAVDAVDLDKIKKEHQGIVEQFWSGKEQILIAHNDARESYNLQIADALVFYCLPWNPRDMEQWLGRISRLGLRKKKIVEIIALVQKGMIDEKIASLYDSLGMFHQPVDLEKNEKILDEKTKDIRRAVLENSDISDAKEKIVEEPKFAGSFMHIVPQDDAYHLLDEVQRVVEPVIKKAENSGHEIDDPKEEALLNWLDVLCEHKFCFEKEYSDKNYKDKPNPWYYKFRVMQKTPDFKFPAFDGVPYVLRRVHIQMPPRDFVPIFQWEKGEKQRYEVPYQFFNFGSKLHDELLENFAALLKPFEPPNLVNFSVILDPKQFVHNPETKAGKYLVSVATVRRIRLDTNSPIERLTRGLDKNVNKTQEEMRQTECRRLENGLKADDRFLDCLFPGSLVILGYALKDGQWSRMKELSSFYDFLTCLPESVERFETSTIQSDFRTKLTERLVRAIPEQWKSDFTKQIENRIATIEQETQVREEVLRLKIADRQKRIEEETNEQVVRLNFQPEKTRLEEHLLLVRLQHDIRTTFLTESAAAANDPQIQRQLVIHFDVKIKE